MSNQGSMYFSYDVDGSIISLNYQNKEYFYVKNIQGDIIQILDETFEIVVEYKYDAWGNLIDSYNNSSLGFDLSNLNPYRYRSYRFDNELGLYYLQSRYYDPSVGRFISPDSINYLDPNTPTGLNLYVYCGNNPVMYSNPSGNIAISITALIIIGVMLFTPIGGVVTQTAVSAVNYIGMAVFSIWDKDVRGDMDAIGWNPFNSSEDKVLKSKKFSFYKGVPVFRYGDNKTTSGFSFEVIGVGRGVASMDLVKHEYGHSLQTMPLGPGTTLFLIAIPSLISIITDRDNHRNQWFERWADELGGAHW